MIARPTSWDRALHDAVYEMITFSRPSIRSIEQFLDCQHSLPFTYDTQEATRRDPPAGFDVDHTRIRLGEGAETFEAACAAFRDWQQFDLGWVTAGPTTTPIEVGQVIAVWASKVGLTWVNACRIVYVLDDDGPVRRFGFAYGTLPGHVEAGEERFLIEWDRASDDVHYDILAYSRPRHWLIRLAYPFMRQSQKRFARDSAAAMQAAVSPESRP